MAPLRYSFEDLVQNLEGRRRLGEEPPVLLLGAGASAAAGLATMRALYEAEGIAPDAADAFDRFCERMARRDDRERFRFLASMLQTSDPHQVTPGYRALARLCAQHVFDIVLSANLDPLLEDAFSETALKRRDVLVLVNGVLRRERLPLLLMGGVPRVKLVKLHGDLFHRYMAWTPDEMETYLREITPALRKALAMRDVLVVGYSMRDPAVRALALSTGGTVWYAGPSEPPADVAALLAKAKVRLLVEERCRFESFFPALAAALGVAVEVASATAVAAPVAPAAGAGGAAAAVRRGAATASAAPPPRFSARRAPAAPDRAGRPPETADNLDDVLAATVGIARAPDGALAATGFLLAEPRVIVTDGWWAARSFGDTAEIVTQAGDRHRCRVLARLDLHPFGPALLEVPKTLHAAGLRLDAGPLPRGLPVHAVVGTNVRRFLMEGGMPVAQAVAAGMIDAATGRSIAAALARKARGGGPAVAQWQRFSVTGGTVKALLAKPVPIAPVGDVPGLVEIEMATAPGSSGAPVVDAAFAVRGYIVAGSIDPARPLTYMLGAATWAGGLESWSRQVVAKGS